MTTVTLLDAVASHETKLMERVASAKEEARATVERAQAAAAEHISQEQAKTEAEAAERRRKAAEARDIEQRERQAATDAKVAEIRDRAAGAIDSVRDEIVAQLVPQR